MSVDPNSTVLLSDNSSFKLLKSGTGTIHVAGLSGTGTLVSQATIPHGYTSDELLFEVFSSSGYVDGTMLPWASNDNRLRQYARIDSTNLYILIIISDNSGYGFPAFDVDYSYRILIP